MEKRVRQLKREKEKLLDLGLKNRQDLTPTFENINAEEWVKQYHELNYDLEITETELKVARATHKELFGGEERKRRKRQKINHLKENPVNLEDSFKWSNF